jgi:hypothetical protein
MDKQWFVLFTPCMNSTLPSSTSKILGLLFGYTLLAMIKTQILVSVKRIVINGDMKNPSKVYLGVVIIHTIKRMRGKCQIVKPLKLSVKSGDYGVRMASFGIIGHQMRNWE